MDKIRFGKTGLMVSRVAFGGIPIQRLSERDAVEVVRGVIGLGVNFIDTANGYTDSEEKIGAAIRDMPRDGLVIASKSGARDKKTFLEHLDLSLKRLGTDYVDLYQHHGVSSDEQYDALFAEGGVYEGMTEGVRAGKIRFPAISSHSVALSLRIMRDGKFDAVQLPFNFVDDEAESEAVPLAKELDVGFIAMKPMGGGLLPDAKTAFRYLMKFGHIVPDPGIEKLSEMEEIVGVYETGGEYTEADAAAIGAAKAELGSNWCHRCDYCRPCPQGIGISTALNVESFLKRMPLSRARSLAESAIAAAAECTECRACVAKCPYGLDIPAMLKRRIAFWDEYITKNA